MLLGWGLVGVSVGCVGFWGGEGRRDEEIGEVDEGVELRAVFCFTEGASCLVVLFSYRTICFFLSYFYILSTSLFPTCLYSRRQKLLNCNSVLYYRHACKCTLIDQTHPSTEESNMKI